MLKNGKLPEIAISAVGVEKIYRGEKRGEASKHALKSIDIEIPRGSLFGLLGPNGAGKSSFINILAGLVNKSSGRVSIWGHDIDDEERRARSSIGVVPQELNIDAFFTPLELLEVQAGLYGVPKDERRSQELLEMMQLSDKQHSYMRTLSGGMRRRLMVAKAMVHRPPILVLDEPTAGVDVELRQALWGQIKRLNHMGVTVILTTHYLEEAEALCDMVAIIDEGNLVTSAPTSELLGQLDEKLLHIDLADSIGNIPENLKVYSPLLEKSNRLTLRYSRSRHQMGKILEELNLAKLNIADISTEEGDLEDIFLKLTRKKEAEYA